jgi:hypothetical protein
VLENSASAENIISKSLIAKGIGSVSLICRFCNLAGINSENSLTTGYVVPLSTIKPSKVLISIIIDCWTDIYESGFLIQST